jgi:hypothetical protein
MGQLILGRQQKKCGQNLFRSFTVSVPQPDLSVRRLRLHRLAAHRVSRRAAAAAHSRKKPTSRKEEFFFKSEFSAPRVPVILPPTTGFTSHPKMQCRFILFRCAEVFTPRHGSFVLAASYNGLRFFLFFSAFFVRPGFFM